MNVRTLTFGVAILLSAAVLAAQEQPAPVFRAGVELVRLDVRVIGPDGKPVPDLRREEIEVFENGQRRPIVLFQRIHEPSAPPATEASAVTRDISTNQGAPRGHLYVFVFDQQHISAGNEQRARHAAERFLRSRLRPIDRAALYALPGPGPQVDFTRDVDRLVAELPKIRGDLDRNGLGALGNIAVHDAYEIVRGNELVLRRVAQRLAQESGAADLPAVAVGAAGGSAASDANTFHMVVKENARSIVAKEDEAGRRFLAMLSDVVKALRGIEGRKSLVLFSEGFYSDNLSREIELVAAAASQSYVATYSMDLNRRDGAINEGQPVGGSHASDIQNRIEPLASLAIETAGVFVPDATNQLDTTLGRIATQGEDYYIVGFEPDLRALKERGRYRRVTVRTSRSGASASTRTGYAVHDESTPADRRRTIDAALKAPYPQQAIPIEYTTYVMKGATAVSERVFLAVEADLPVAGPTQPATADVVFVARNVQDGRVVASGTDTMRMPDAASSGRTTGKGRYRVQFDAPPGRYVMRVVVREPGGAVGSADRHFTVRRLDAPSVTVSDVVLGASGSALPVRADVYVGDGLTGVMELYARTSAALQQVDVTLMLTPIAGDREVISAHAELGDIKQAASSVTRPAKIAVPLTNVAPGEYFVRVRVREGSEIVAELERDVRVVAGNAPAARTLASQPSEVVGGEVAGQLLASLTLPPPLAPAGSLAATGKWAEAASVLPSTLPESTEHLVLRGLMRLHQQAYVDAAADLRAALDRTPGNPRLAFVLGWAYAGCGDMPKAIGAWRTAAYVDPTLVAAHLALADAYVSVSQPALAAQALRAGLRALPNSPELTEKLAAIERN